MKFCQKSISALCRKDLAHYQLFKNICELYIENSEPFEISWYLHEFEDEFIKIINWLEDHGYLVSTETDVDLVKIKPLGIHFKDYEIDDSDFTFCICNSVFSKRDDG